MTPEELDRQMQRGVQLHQQGQLAQAEQIYLLAFQHFPHHADVLNLLGTLCSQDGRHDEGIAYLEQALKLQPQHPHYLLNLGQAQVMSGDLDQALASFSAVLELQPNSAPAHYNLANVLKQKNRLQSALEHYQRALAIAPDSANYHYNYGNALQAAGRYRSAIEAYEKALSINPEDARAHNNIGIVLREWDRFDEALAHYKKAVELRPDFEDAYLNLFQIYESQDQCDQALQCLDTLESLHTACPHLKLRRAAVFPLIPQSRQQISQAMQNLSATLDELVGHRFDLEKLVKYDLQPPSIMAYYGEHDRELRERYARLFTGAIQSLQPLPERQHNAKPGIAFLVTRGHEGVFIKCMAGLIKQLPNSLDVRVLCVAPNGKHILTKELPDADIVELDPQLETAARQIHRLELDVLYYWEVGTDSFNYLLPFFKAARLQVNFWGWPVTSGMPQMDYYLSCEHLETENAQQDYTERLIRLARLPVYYYQPPVPKLDVNRQTFGLSECDHVYLCAQNLRKVHPDMDEAFKQILLADDKALIVFIHDKHRTVTQKLQHRLSQHLGDAADRLRYLDRMPAETYLGLVKTADVILDTFHYTGGANTSYDAFAAGTPVITWPSDMHRGRYTYAAYRQMGYMELVARNRLDYIKKAVAIANDKQLRHSASEAVLNGCGSLIEDRQAVDAFVASVFQLLDEQEPERSGL